MVRIGILIILMTLGGARKEAAKRWPDGRWILRVDQTKPQYIYELEVTVDTQRSGFMGSLGCQPLTRQFRGSSWQQVFDQSRDFKTTCIRPS